jgi:hypothetical protein
VLGFIRGSTNGWRRFDPTPTALATTRRSAAERNPESPVRAHSGTPSRFRRAPSSARTRRLKHRSSFSATPPMGFGAFRRNQLRRSCVPACLTDTIRSRSFSLPQRFNPSETSWLCFTPLPSIGFGPSELFPPSQPLRLSTPVALLLFSRATDNGTNPMSINSYRSSRALLRLSIRHPNEVEYTSPSRCSPGLSPLRGLPVSTAGPKSSPPALHPTSASTVATVDKDQWVAPQGLTVEPGDDSESRLSPHEVFHLIHPRTRATSSAE